MKCFLLSPFVGEKELLAEIEQAGGLEKWESPVGTPRSKAEALQKMWIEMKRQWLSRSGPPFPISLAVGKRDKLLTSNQFFVFNKLRPNAYRTWKNEFRDIEEAANRLPSGNDQYQQHPR